MDELCTSHEVIIDFVCAFDYCRVHVDWLIQTLYWLIMPHTMVSILVNKKDKESSHDICRNPTIAQSMLMLPALFEA